MINRVLKLLFTQSDYIGVKILPLDHVDIYFRKTTTSSKLFSNTSIFKNYLCIKIIISFYQMDYASCSLSFRFCTTSNSIYRANATEGKDFSSQHKTSRHLSWFKWTYDTIPTTISLGTEKFANSLTRIFGKITRSKEY